MLSPAWTITAGFNSPQDLIADISALVDFWGPASNFGIPVAAVLDTQKSPDL